MGYQERDYYREAPRGIVLGSGHSAVAIILIINVAVFVVDWLGQGALKTTLHLESTVFQEPWKLWQLLTYGFLHAGVGHLFFNMLGLWIFGRDVESIHGKRRFFEFYISTIILSGLIWVGGSMILDEGVKSVIGASGGVVGLVIVSVLHNPHRTLMLLMPPMPVPAWVIGMLVVGMDVVRLMGSATGTSDSDIAFTAHLGGALMGFIFYSSGWTLATPLPTSFSLKGVKRRVTGPKLKIHKPSRVEPEEDLNEQVDAILAKISEQGQDSLTSKEKKILEKASRQAKEKKKHEVNP